MSESLLLTKQFPIEDIERGLHAFSWLAPARPLQPVMTSLFGDVFFMDSDYGYWYLSLLDATLTRDWQSREELQATLESDDGRADYLLDGLALSAHHRGLVLEPSEVYAFSPPPQLGGSFDVENIVKLPLTVALTISGDLGSQAS